MGSGFVGRLAARAYELELFANGTRAYHPEVETKAVRSAFDAMKQEMVPHHLCREFSEGLLEEERQEEMMGTREDHDKLLPYDTGDLEERVARVHINKLLPFTAEDMEESPDFADI